MNQKKSKVGGIIGLIAVVLVIGLTVYAFIKDAKTESHVEEITYSEFKDKVDMAAAVLILESYLRRNK